MSPVEPAVHAAARALSPAPVDRVAVAAAGGNSRIFRVEAGGRCYALKAYPSRDVDPRDRLGHEFEAYALLHAHGLGARVPAPVARDAEGVFALYDWVEGATVDRIGSAEIDDALAFVADLRRLSRRAPPGAVRPAVEASFAVADTILDVRRRATFLAGVPPADPSPAEILAAVDSALDRAATVAAARLAAVGDSLDRNLAPAWRTLSPSDFGFHNALRRDGGAIVYLDFEYFGADDPTRLVGDFLLHPGMSIGADPARRFLDGAGRIFAEMPGFRARLDAHLPPMALRWCLILLNEYVPGRRRVGDVTPADRHTVLARQLAKAEAMLETAIAVMDSGGGGVIEARRAAMTRGRG